MVRVPFWSRMFTLAQTGAFGCIWDGLSKAGGGEGQTGIVFGRILNAGCRDIAGALLGHMQFWSRMRTMARTECFLMLCGGVGGNADAKTLLSHI